MDSNDTPQHSKKFGQAYLELEDFASGNHALRKLSEKVDKVVSHLNGEKPKFREQPPPLPDLASLFKPDPWTPHSESRYLLANAELDDVPDEIFAVIFRSMEYRMMITLRAVSHRFRRIIDLPFYAMRRWSVSVRMRLDSDDIKQSQHLMDFAKVAARDEKEEEDGTGSRGIIPLLQNVNNVRRATFELQEDEDSHFDEDMSEGSYFVTSYTITFPHRNHHRLNFDFLKSDLLRVIAKHPSWFIEASLQLKKKQDRFRDVRTATYLEFIANISKMEFDCRSDPEHTLADARVVLLSKSTDNFLYDGGEFRKHLHCYLKRDLPGISRESLPLTINPAHQDALTCAQLQLVEWLQHAEKRVLRSESLAAIKPTFRLTMMVGTRFTFDPFCSVVGELRVDCAVNKVEMELITRGVVIADDPGLGQTRAVVEFLLGSVGDLSHLSDLMAAGDPATVTDRSGPEDQLLWTKAIDFGSQLPIAQEDLLPFGMLHTSAALVVVSTATFGTWKREVAEIFPHKNVIFVGSRTDHESLTYGQVASADLVVVTAQFLKNRDYYEGVRWSGLRSKQRVARTEALLLAEARNSLNVLTQKRSQLFCYTRGPVFEWFAWPRIVVDEIHTLIVPSKRMSDFNKLGLHFYSARFVVAISATPQLSAEKMDRILYHEKDNIIDLIFTKWMRTGYRFPHDTKVTTIDVLPCPCYLRDAPGNAALGIVYPLIKFERSLLITPKGGDPYTPFSFCLPQQTILALVHRNTLKNIPPVKKVVLSIRLNPAISILQMLIRVASVLNWPNASLLNHFPLRLGILYNTVGSKETFKHITDVNSLWSEFLEDVVHRINKHNRVMDIISAEDLSLLSECKRDFIEVNLADMKEQSALFASLPKRLEHLGLLLQDTIPFYGPVEEAYGSRAHFLIRLVRGALAHTPNARVIVATDETNAVAFLLKKYVEEPFVMLGGLNLRATQANETAFRKGTARVLILDTTKAAEGFNLQRAHVIIVDKWMNAEEFSQTVGRVVRPDAEQAPVVIARGKFTGYVHEEDFD